MGGHAGPQTRPRRFKNWHATSCELARKRISLYICFHCVCTCAHEAEPERERERERERKHKSSAERDPLASLPYIPS